MRNREIGLYCGVSVIICVAFAVAGFYISTVAGLLCLLLGLALTGWGLAFTAWRYKKIRKLCQALAAGAAGEHVPDLRTNREGELSILQNDLYKVTSMLSGKAERMRADKLFLADALGDISHQLKTPLTSLMVSSDLLLEEDLPPERRKEFAGRISSQLERLRWLVSALLRISRLDAAVVDFKREELALHTLVSRSVEPLLPLAEQRDVALAVDCPRQLYWTGDMEWTAEALGNFVKNCIEHAPRGGHVQISCSDNPLHTQIIIEDDGPGFGSEDLPRLFERFYRGRDAGSENVGIGLAMARSILLAQGSDAGAENRTEGGARFIVRLYKTVASTPGTPAG